MGIRQVFLFDTFLEAAEEYLRRKGSADGEMVARAIIFVAIQTILHAVRIDPHFADSLLTECDDQTPWTAQHDQWLRDLIEAANRAAAFTEN